MFPKPTFILSILFCCWFASSCQAQISQAPNSKLAGSSATNLDWLTPEERQFLKDHPTLKVAPTPHFPPFEYWDPGYSLESDKDDTFSGVVSSYLKHFEKELGIKFELVRTEKWADNLAKLESKQIDAVGLLVPWSDRPYVAVSKAYITYPACIVVRKEVTGDLSLKDLVGKKVAVPNN